MARWPFTLLGTVAAIAGFYTFALCLESIWELIRLRWPQPPAQPMTGPAFLAVGGIYFLDIAFMGVATALLAALAIWGIEPRKRWREWRSRARAA